MFYKSLAAAAASLTFAAPAFADIMIMDAYARSAMPGAKTGAAFMMIENTGAEADRLIDARADFAAKVELHTHEDQGDGVMKMMHVEEGFALPAGETHMLARGGDHVMFMGLTKPLVQGESVSVTLVFEKAGEKVIEIPVDLERKAKHGMAHDHSHGH
ncbi:copper chaperone PCu(A)C [Pacificoceanicola onchidii]|uniref:copper chaperone PCu(A)C n=1 Tax=Pacificoceanicola onchidii TaxID=2562685 RepID=UPI0010A4C222|nr:copper chaperone PCu(A)C [Pacificoceanicola onchidii]